MAIKMTASGDLRTLGSMAREFASVCERMQLRAAANDEAAEAREAELLVRERRARVQGKVNVLNPLLKAHVKRIIDRRVSVVEAVEKDDRMRRAMVDLLRDLHDDIEREWEW